MAVIPYRSTNPAGEHRAGYPSQANAIPAKAVALPSATRAAASKRKPSDSHAGFISAVEATRLLGIRPQTLYAYVSRGWISSTALPGRKERLYSREDVERVRRRSDARAGHGAVAAAAMDWGEPIFSTSITEITLQGPCYRGHPAITLIRQQHSFEAVAELLWVGTLPTEAPNWPVQRPSKALLNLSDIISALAPRTNILETFATVLLVLGLRRGSTAQRVAGGKTLQAARETLQALVACLGLIGPGRQFRPMRQGETILQALMTSLGVTAQHENREALRAILILLADHELSPGTFCARVVASGGGSLQSCLASALCATSGVDVGSMYQQVERLLGRTRSASVLMRRAHELMDRGQNVPGFQHPLYPDGDPRAAEFLDIARRRTDPLPQSRAIFEFIDQMRRSANMHPRQELAMVVLNRSLGLPAEAAPALFSLSRLAGWVAHVLEQRSEGRLLRPRAKFSASQTAPPPP